jgi:hypothetical protein
LKADVYASKDWLRPRHEFLLKGMPKFGGE